MSKFRVTFKYDGQASLGEVLELSAAILRVFAKDEDFDPAKFAFEQYNDEALSHQMFIDVEGTAADMEERRAQFNESVLMNDRYELEVTPL